MGRLFVDDTHEMSLVEYALGHQASAVSLDDSFRRGNGTDHIILVHADAVGAQKSQLSTGVGGPADNFTHVRESSIVHYRRSMCVEQVEVR